jgi:3-(3-hydroxy-phenyl)propionate hydroxylase
VADTYFAIIIGGGPVGMMLATLMGPSGAPILVLEKRLTPYTAPRAIAYDAETLQMFQKIELLDRLEPSLERDVPVAYFNQNGRELMRMSRPTQPYGQFSIGQLLPTRAGSGPSRWL